MMLKIRLLDYNILVFHIWLYGIFSLCKKNSPKLKHA